MSELKTGRSTRFGFRLLKLALVPERAELHRRIELRLGAMLEVGFLDEVRALRARGDLSPDLPAMRAVGYRQAWRHLDRIIDAAAFRAEALAATRQLAKRQVTWLRGMLDVRWLAHAEEAILALRLFLSRHPMREPKARRFADI